MPGLKTKIERFAMKSALKSYINSQSESENSIDLHFNLLIERNGIASSIDRILSDLPSENALVITGPNTYDKLGKDVVEALGERLDSVEYVVYEDKTLTDWGVARLFDQLVAVKKGEISEYFTDAIKKNSDYDICFAVGGGKITDLGKIVSYKNFPYVTIPTQLTSDSASTSFASIEVDGKKVSVTGKHPNRMIAHTKTLRDSPNLNSGCADIMAKYVSCEDWKLAHTKSKDIQFSRGLYTALREGSLAFMELINNLDKKNGKIQITENFMDMVVTGIGVAGTLSYATRSTQPISGGEHNFSHALRSNLPHGYPVGVGTIICAYLHGLEWKPVRGTLEYMDAPITAEQLGVSDKECYTAAIKARTIRPRYTILKNVTDYQIGKAMKKQALSLKASSEQFYRLLH
ncbi:MAG: iron-containing alcohol dehydrogenase [Candidatus Nanoarchaeia archaeon]|nr:iron-containing alcohol dehydrogenase [Candidatus Nanoarchaeia archaeon]